MVSSSDLIAISGVLVAIISFWVARKTLIDAEEYWKQQKWFDLYAKADQAYNDLELYQVNYKGTKGVLTVQQATDWNNLMFSIRSVHTMAMVFPVCSVITKLVKATSHFEDAVDAFDSERKPVFNDAVEELRQMARLNPAVLQRRDVPK